MLVACPNCATSYDVDIASLRAAGHRVRCQRCDGVWHVERPQAAKLLAAANALAPVRLAIEAVALTVAEESALAREAGWPAGAMTEPMVEPAADDGGGQAAAVMPEISYEQALWDAPADPSGTEADHSVFAPVLPVSAPPAEEPRSASQLVAPVNVALAALLQQLDGQAIKAEPEPEPEPEPEAIAFESWDAEQALTARNDAAGNELIAGLATMVAEQARRRRGRWRLPVSRLLLVILGLLVTDAIIIGRRTDLVRAMPQTASFYARLGAPVNLRGIDFDGVGAVTEEHGNSAVLVVTGDVLNRTADTQEVPQLQFALRNAEHEEIYSWTVAPARITLPAGEALTFRSQLPAPPLDTQEVLVSFVDRADSRR
jgi:predicted Zn finger-like uncharacterized protein